MAGGWQIHWARSSTHGSRCWAPSNSEEKRGRRYFESQRTGASASSFCEGCHAVQSHGITCLDLGCKSRILSPVRAQEEAFSANRAPATRATPFFFSPSGSRNLARGPKIIIITGALLALPSLPILECSAPSLHQPSEVPKHGPELEPSDSPLIRYTGTERSISGTHFDLHSDAILFRCSSIWVWV